MILYKENMLDLFVKYDIIILVMQMTIADKIIITDIATPGIVHSEKGRCMEMEKRLYYGLSLCLGGQITYTMNGKKYVSNQDSAVLLPQGGTYSLYGDKEGLFPLINFRCENYACDEIGVFALENPQACIKDFETIRNLMLYGGSRLKIYSVFYELLSKVFSLSASMHTPMHSAIQYIEKNISDPNLSNEEIAKKMGISEVYLRKLFATHQKTTPKQYILDMRIRKAKQLLVDTPFTITAIAEECGFSSLYHFCRVFKLRTGTTPSEYAAKNRIYKI